VNTSVVHGELPPAAQKMLNVSHGDFFACGLSLVLHPKNPFVPTVHLNVRYFELYDEQQQLVDAWFGGGSDLTPYYLFEEDAQHFHYTLQQTCVPLGEDKYAQFKTRCDTYFFNPHRGEGRGIGGIFFEHCRPNATHSLNDWYEFAQRVGNAFLPSYLPIVERRHTIPHSEAERYWQEIRRGRYVEFNLLHDRGTLFGIKTNGRTESILMSLPPRVRWDYDHHPEAGSKEDALLTVLKEPKNWIKSTHATTT